MTTPAELACASPRPPPAELAWGGVAWLPSPGGAANFFGVVGWPGLWNPSQVGLDMDQEHQARMASL
eukprot:12930890-Prorocentrum_lima.AAC.1